MRPRLFDRILIWKSGARSTMRPDFTSYNATSNLIMFILITDRLHQFDGLQRPSLFIKVIW